MNDEHPSDKAWDAEYKRERREEMELAVRMNLEVNATARDEALVAEQEIYAVRHAAEVDEQDARIERLDANERARDAEAREYADRRESRLIERQLKAEERNDAKTTERDRRVTWWCAVNGALANPNGSSLEDAWLAADRTLAEYDKRWPA